MSLNKADYKICVVGLGYVGLPLAARLSFKQLNVVGFDIDENRVHELVNNIDRNDDIELKHLNTLNQNSKLTFKLSDIKDCNIFIITVPTPINDDKSPDLGPIIYASKLVGSLIKEGSIVIYESTVYPGVTDDICTPILEKESNLIFNIDFATGYSPERIVPGDKVNTIEKIKKIVSGSNKEALEIISFIYSLIIDAGVYEAPSIKVAEAAKVTENIQRDVNIALINEMHQLYSSLDINTLDVIEAASTKWNFMKLTPGLVGGHCISIDPYYLMHKSLISGYTPNLMRTARKINDKMYEWVLKDFLKCMKLKEVDLQSTVITILGYTFKENCSDTRNTKVKSLISSMKDRNIKIKLWDPMISKEDRQALSDDGIETYNEEPKDVKVAFICVYHDQIINFIKNFDGIIYDYKDSTRDI